MFIITDNSSVAKEVEPSLLIKQNLFELEVEILEVQTKAVEEGEKMENESEVSKEAVNEESLQFPENGTTDLLDVNNTE